MPETLQNCQAGCTSAAKCTLTTGGRKWCMAFRLCTLLCLLWAGSARGEITVTSDFEGGSAKVLALDQASRTIRICPAGDPACGWPCWWYLRVGGLTVGEKLTLEVTASEARLTQGKNAGKPLAASWSQPERATWSSDGKSWRHTDPGIPRDGRICYSVAAAGNVLWLAWGPPFTPRDSTGLVKLLAKDKPWAEAFELSQSRAGRTCPALRLCQGDRPTEDRPAIWLQARQHAWESGGSWVCRGLAEWLAGDDPRARHLREKTEIYVVPIMDIDNTATGNGGKEALPQDHNRDWTDQPHHAEVAAAQKHLRRLSKENRLALFIDLHNPGPNDKQPYFYTCPEETLTELGRRNLDRLLTVCRTELTGPLTLSDKPRVSGPSYDPLWKQMSKNWVAAHAPPHAVAVTLETAWNTPASTTDGYRALGLQLGQAIERYLRVDPRK
jgi:Zinc carboxypeptidase/Cytosolic carboxypeptidase N-terminal domain